MQVSAAGDSVAEWLAWRGGAHVLPVGRGIAYREHHAEYGSEPFGAGLLFPGDPHVQRLPFNGSLEHATRAELLLFGTGQLVGPDCWMNGQPLQLFSLSELATGEFRYPSYSYSAHRVYSLAEVPLDLIRNDNELRVALTHAYWQSAILRIFEEAPELDLHLEVTHDLDRYTLELTGSSLADVSEVDFFVRHRGMDLDGSAQEVTWQAVVNRDQGHDSGYRLDGHIGTVQQAPWVASWLAELAPRGTIEFRCRVRLLDGLIVDSPGGSVVWQHAPDFHLVVLRPQGFQPFAFHENGANQDKRLTCELRIDGEDWDQVSTRHLQRGVLAVPLYGLVTILFNQRHELFAVGPVGAYSLRRVELPTKWLYSRVNHFDAIASGDTGCFQAPGPCLYLYYE